MKEETISKLVLIKFVGLSLLTHTEKHLLKSEMAKICNMLYVFASTILCMKAIY